MDTQKDKATPRPWMIYPDSGNFLKVIQTKAFKSLKKDYLLSKDFGFVCELELGDESNPEDGMDNASLIVKAVNNYDVLLEACKEAKKKLESIEYDSASDEIKSAVDVLTQAINQATK